MLILSQCDVSLSSAHFLSQSLRCYRIARDAQSGKEEWEKPVQQYQAQHPKHHLINKPFLSSTVTSIMTCLANLPAQGGCRITCTSLANRHKCCHRYSKERRNDPHYCCTTCCTIHVTLLALHFPCLRPQDHYATDHAIHETSWLKSANTKLKLEGIYQLDLQ